MPSLRKWVTLGLPVVAITAGLTFAGHRMVGAADHLDPPARVGADIDAQTDPAADIADVYAFHDANNVYLALNFAGPAAPGVPAFYDRNVLYTINLSNDGNRTTVEFPIEVRFGFDGTAPGVRVSGLPPTGRVIQGPVETNITGENGIVVRAGLFDDPFLFDLQGFRQTVATGTLAFSNTRNAFDGRNDTYIILSIPRSLVARGQVLDVWATTARIGS